MLLKGSVFTSPRGKGGNVVAKVSAIIAPIAEEMGLDIWDIRFVKEGGVGIDDCVDFSHAIDGPLDEADPVPESYCLEVSSPGMERELTRPEHFEKLLGKTVKTMLYRPGPSGKREITGTLTGHDSSSFTIKDSEYELVLDRKDVNWVRLDDSDEYKL